MANCLMCNGTGRTKKDPFRCEACGAEYSVGPLLKVDNFGIYVPQEYREDVWDLDIYKEGIKRKYENKAQKEQAIKWASVLDNLLKSVSNKKLIPGAFYVSAPTGTSKTRWQYTMQAMAADRGYQIFPITDVIEINMGMDMEDLIMSDFLVLRVTNYKVKEALEKLNFIIPKRRDRDLTTIIMSTLPYRYLATQIEYVTFEMDLLIELHI